MTCCIKLTTRIQENILLLSSSSEFYHFENQSKIMDQKSSLITDISPGQRNWTSKVVVAEKTPPKLSQNGQTRYQHMILMDEKGNRVQATLWDNSIAAFKDDLSIGKTYFISNATVKHTKVGYKNAYGDIQWTISGTTQVEETNVDHSAQLFSTFEFTPFHEFETLMDTDKDLSVFAVAIDLRPRRLIHTRDGSETYVQDVVLIDKNFQTILLTMWDTFVEKECSTIAQNISKKPVIIGLHLRVSSFNGLTLSTRPHSCFFIDHKFKEVDEMKSWTVDNSGRLDEITGMKAYNLLSPSKLSPPAANKYTQILEIQSSILTNKYFWIKAKAHIQSNNTSFWYLSCNNCNRVSNANKAGEIYSCRFCKSNCSIASPRARADVILEDSTGNLKASVMGECAEKMLACPANVLMKKNISDITLSNDEDIRIDINNEHIFYIKALPMAAGSPSTKCIGYSNFKYEIIFMLDSSETFPAPTMVSDDKGKDKISLEGVATSNKIVLPQSPPAKRSLFENHDEQPHTTNKKAEKMGNKDAAAAALKKLL